MLAFFLYYQKRRDEKMLEGKVLKDFADKEDNYRVYKAGKTFKAEESRYNSLKQKGYVGEGKETTKKEESK